MRRTGWTWLAVGAVLTGWMANAATEEGDAFPENIYSLKTTKQFLDACGAHAQHPQFEGATDFCIGFVAGAMQSYRVLAEKPTTASITCPGGQVPPQEVLQVFLDWARKNAPLWDEPPVQGVIRAASERWPCGL